MRAIDFEFYDSNESHPTLICAAMDGKVYWLFDGSDKAKLIEDIKQYSHEFIAHYVIAEARCFLALGLNPLDFKWVDSYIEFKMQQNSNNKYAYGKFIDSDGEIKISYPPKPQEEKIKINNQKVPANMINAVYKNTGEIISSKEKTEVRELILSKNSELINKNKERILAYCLEDTRYLIPMYDSIQSMYYSSGLRNFEESIYERGRYAAATAICEHNGIPINLELLNVIIEKTPIILDESKDVVNAQFEQLIGRKLFKPEYQKPPKTYKNGKLHNYKPEPAVEDTKAMQHLIHTLNISDWPKTEKGSFSVKKESLETYRYIPIIESIYLHNKTESSLKWFNRSNGDGFFESFGSDNCVRPFYGIFGTQTGRNAAKAKSFPLAMSGWLRTIIQPPKDWFIIAADFSQQEVAVAAELSGDKNLVNAYNSGDVYLEFAKQAGLIPSSATKKTHKAERDLCKSTVLGLQYGMGKYKLQHKLSYDSGAPVSMEKTMELITAHKTVFWQYWEWVYDLSRKYESGIPLLTNDGFVLWQDNPILTSVRNFPVQANSASITRTATVSACEERFKVMCQLHDALYILTQNPQTDELRLKDIMGQAVKKILGSNSIDIRIDTKTISHSDLWVEDKAIADWNRINKHLNISKVA